jgi:hypothetical protein
MHGAILLRQRSSHTCSLIKNGSVFLTANFCYVCVKSVSLEFNYGKCIKLKVSKTGKMTSYADVMYHSSY